MSFTVVVVVGENYPSFTVVAAFTSFSEAERFVKESACEPGEDYNFKVGDCGYDNLTTHEAPMGLVG